MTPQIWGELLKVCISNVYLNKIVGEDMSRSKSSNRDKAFDENENLFINENLGLTEKQKLFCENYLISLNATQAAINAGYSEKNADKIGSELLGKTRVSNYIKKRMETKITDLIASQDEVLKFLTSAMRGKEIDETVVVEGQGKGLSKTKILKLKISSKDRIRAAELLGKRYQIFTDKVKTEGDIIIFSGEENLE